MNFKNLFLLSEGGSTVGLETIYSGDVFEMLQQIMSKDDTLRYRVYKVNSDKQ